MIPRKIGDQFNMDKGQQNKAKSIPQVPLEEPVQETEPEMVVAEVVEELTEQELAERHRLEQKVERTFVEAGKALRDLRDRRLYRDHYKTFEAYCQVRFGYTRRSVDYLIAGSGVVDNLNTRREQHQDAAPEMRKNLSQKILPTKLEQIRSLNNLEPEQQCQVWEEAVEAAGGKVPSGRIVKGIVERLKEKHLPQLSITYKRGEVFTLQGLTGAERRYNGCWAIAREVLEFSLKVETHDAMLLVKPENLDPIDDHVVRRQLPALLKRIQRLRKRELDRSAEVILESLGKRMYLTDLEEELLTWLENYYQVG